VWKISKITDPMGYVTVYGYDDKGQLMLVGYPDGVGVYLEHDSNGNVTKVTRNRAS
jgi:uncharacterized protein RhaS with RHS repeats